MITPSNAIAVPRSAGPIAAVRPYALVLLVALLAACQSTPEALLDASPPLRITASPIVSDDGGLDGGVARGTIVIAIPAEAWMHDVRFYVGLELRHVSTSPPFEYVLDTTTMIDGTYVLSIEARHAGGQVGAHESAGFTVDNAGALLPAPAVRSMTLRGEPDFRADELSDLERLQHDRLWAEISDAGNRSEIMALAGRDDVFLYGRSLHGYVQSVLTAFRVTGDLALLDHVDVILERMRLELRDAWRGTNDGSDGTRDGFLNWVYRYSDTPEHQGKDTRFIDDIKVHGMVAMVAYALDVNRDLVSPGGRDYGAHADFWRDYLVNHFEAKWRERRGVATGFPFLTHPDGHTYWTWTKWHLFMGRLTGDDAYLREAHRMADVIWDDIRSESVSGGSAFVWASNIMSLSESRNYLMSTGYAHSVLGDVVTFHLEGFHRWADEENVRAFARTVTEFVFDTSDPVRHGLAPDVGGGEDRAGIVSESPTPRRSAEAFTGYQYALIGGWDVSGQMIEMTYRVQEMYPVQDTARLASGLLLSARLHPVATSAVVSGATTSASVAR